jgi:hypothetical protein
MRPLQKPNRTLLKSVQVTGSFLYRDKPGPCRRGPVWPGRRRPSLAKKSCARQEMAVFSGWGAGKEDEPAWQGQAVGRAIGGEATVRPVARRRQAMEKPGGKLGR